MRVIAVCVGVVGFAYFWGSALDHKEWPGHADPSYYYTVATNVAQGRGLVVDYVWHFLWPHRELTHPSNDYWMPLPSLAMGGVMGMAGLGFRVAQVVPCCFASVLCVLACIASYRATGSRACAVLAALFLGTNPAVIGMAISTTSGAFYALFAVSSIIAVCRGRGGAAGGWHTPRPPDAWRP